MADWSLAAPRRHRPWRLHWQLQAADGDYGLQLDLRTARSPVLNGAAGLSRKADAARRGELLLLDAAPCGDRDAFARRTQLPGLGQLPGWTASGAAGRWAAASRAGTGSRCISTMAARSCSMRCAIAMDARRAQCRHVRRCRRWRAVPGHEDVTIEVTEHWTGRGRRPLSLRTGASTSAVARPGRTGEAAAGRPGTEDHAALLGGRGGGAPARARGARRRPRLCGTGRLRAGTLTFAGHWRRLQPCPMMATRPVTARPSSLEISMRRLLVAAATAALIALPVFAALPNGTKAPDFTIDAALAGKDFKFILADALKQGPVVLYFFPKVFTDGAPPRRTTSPRRPTSSRRWGPPSSASRTTRSTRSPSSPPRNAATSSRSVPMPTAAS